ncbi:hypothetical protein BJV78DRAFT_534046 [Lactifluus subvellereus]|nr:hypothetical protein BJV78DRAFT_534046 [Lactifluus subvellereus]
MRALLLMEGSFVELLRASSRPGSVLELVVLRWPLASDPAFCFHKFHPGKYRLGKRSIVIAITFRPNQRRHIASPAFDLCCPCSAHRHEVFQRLEVPLPSEIRTILKDYAWNSERIGAIYSSIDPDLWVGSALTSSPLSCSTAFHKKVANGLSRETLHCGLLAFDLAHLRVCECEHVADTL